MSKTHTMLVQQPIAFPTDATAAFSQATETVVPVVLIPEPRSCLSCYMSVPSGVYCVEHRFGKDVDRDALSHAGLHCTPSYNRIAYCVTQQACTYNAPVKSCPTADNVMVDCDLTLVFQIGPHPGDVKNFIYTLGARRFDEFLSAAVEEGIRHLIRNCMHTEVYELRGGNDERVKATLTELNNKFNMFGVSFVTAAITDVTFKAELQSTLQKTTQFKSMISEQKKKQANAMDKIGYAKDALLSEQSKMHGRKLQDLEAERTRALIARETQLTAARGAMDVRVTQAEEAKSVASIKVHSEKEVAKQQGEAKRCATVSDAKAKAEEVRIRAKQTAETRIFESEQRLQANKNRAQALLITGKAEAEAAQALQMQRQHELRIAKMSVLEAIAKKTKIVVGGESGDRLINALLDSSVLSPGGRASGIPQRIAK